MAGTTVTGGGGPNRPPQPPNRDPIGTNDLTFPNDLESIGYWITFDFRKYTRRGIRDRAFYAAGGNLRLPLPHNMIDYNSVRWGEEGNGPIMGVALDALAASRNIDSERFREILNNMDPNAGGEAITEILRVLGIASTAASVSAIQSILGRNFAQGAGIFGLAVNPFLTVTFQSPTFKRHSFSWRFAPTRPQETETLHRLLSKFRFHMNASLTNWPGGVMLNYPDMALVTLYPADKYLYKFKPCVVTDAVINYSPNPQLGFFDATKAPSEVVLTVNLLEIEYWLQEDVEATWNVNSSPNGTIPVNTPNPAL